MRAVENLRQGKVVARLSLGTAAHRDAETRAAWLEAIDSDDERVFSARRVVAVDELALDQDAVLNRDSLELAGANAEEGERRIVGRLLLDLETALPTLSPPEAQARRQQKLLPRVGPDGIAETGLVVSSLEAVAPRGLLVGPADRKLCGRRELVVDDRPLANRWPENAKSTLTKRDH